MLAQRSCYADRVRHRARQVRSGKAVNRSCSDRLARSDLTQPDSPLATSNPIVTGLLPNKGASCLEPVMVVVKAVLVAFVVRMPPPPGQGPPVRPQGRRGDLQPTIFFD